jgi:transcriptional regulator with XRE-family HTH domain
MATEPKDLQRTEEGERALRLRKFLGLTQREMGLLFGIEEKTLTRLEARAPWSPPMVRLLRLVEATPVEVSTELLRLMAEEVGDAEPARAEARVALAKAVAAIDQRLGKASSERRLTLEQLAAREKPTAEWVYWATGARAARLETKTLADEEGVICRPLRNAEGRLHPYLLELRRNQRVLLCHDGEPVGWYRLLTSPGGHPAIEDTRPQLPRVFRMVELSSSLGRRLQHGRYMLHDGTPSATAGAGAFSCLAVAHDPRPLVVPRARPPGIRDTMTAFVGGEG